MSYLLDTDICIYLLNGGNTELEKKFRQIASENMCTSTITEAELYYGALHSSRPQKNRERIRSFLSPLQLLTFDAKAASHFAQIKESLFQRGKPTGIMDLLIASIAKANNCRIITNNTKHFENIPHLSIENWSTQL